MVDGAYGARPRFENFLHPLHPSQDLLHAHSVCSPAGTVAFFASIGLPGPLAYLVIAAELLGGLALIAGFKTRIVALVLSVVLLGSIYTPHFANGFFFSNPNGGWEFPAFWAITLWALALLGDGAYALGKSAR